MRGINNVMPGGYPGLIAVSPATLRRRWSERSWKRSAPVSTTNVCRFAWLRGPRTGDGIPRLVASRPLSPIDGRLRRDDSAKSPGVPSKDIRRLCAASSCVMVDLHGVASCCLTCRGIDEKNAVDMKAEAVRHAEVETTNPGAQPILWFRSA